MIAAIKPPPMAGQWHNKNLPLLIGALREKDNGSRAAVTLSPTAHQWRQQPPSRLKKYSGPGHRCRTDRNRDKSAA
jgi:hypothetical protein